MSTLYTRLMDRLVDDAAVFPPGNSPLDAAMVSHRVWRAGPIGRYLGPLLVPAERASELLPMRSDDVVQVALIGTAGAVRDLLAAVRLLDLPGLEVVGVEIPLPDGEVDPAPTVSALAPAFEQGLTVAVEVAGPRAATAVRFLAARSENDSGLLRAKFRTGGVLERQVPTFRELAAVIHAATDAGIGFKLTAGLHHATAARHADGTIRHGVLNLCAATDAADRGAAVALIAAVLADADPARLVRRLDEARIAAVRSSFLSFGCCGVTEPLAEIAATGLIPDLAHGVPG